MGADQAARQFDEMQICCHVGMCLCPGGREHRQEEGLVPKLQSSALQGSSNSSRGLGQEELRNRALPGHHLLSFVTLSSQAARHVLSHLGTAAVPFLADSTDNSELVSHPTTSSQ